MPLIADVVTVRPSGWIEMSFCVWSLRGQAYVQYVDVSYCFLTVLC